MINVFPLPFSITGMRSSSGSTKLIADMAVFSNRAMEVMDHRGREMVNRLVPPDGGCVSQDLCNGNREFWIGWTNYPAPYWNEWNWFVWVGDVSYGAYTLWWYGEWIPHFMV